MLGAPEGETSALGRNFIKTMSKQKVYISGAITGHHMEDVEARFERAKKMLEKVNCEPVSPLENGLPPNATWEAHMARDLEMLSECDAIFMLEGWEQSRGCQIEIRTAIEQRISIIFEQKHSDENTRLHKVATVNTGGKLVS